MDQEIAFLKWFLPRVGTGWIAGGIVGYLLEPTLTAALQGAHIGFVIAMLGIGVWTLRRLQSRQKGKAL